MQHLLAPCCGVVRSIARRRPEFIIANKPTIGVYEEKSVRLETIMLTITALPASHCTPLDRARRLAGEVVHHSVDALDHVDDAGGDAAEEGGSKG
jgi:hypothetical protein